MNYLAGIWSQVRLDREACLSDRQACLAWCQRVGIMPQSKFCRKDRIAYRIESRPDLLIGYCWRCPKCHARKKIGSGTPFEDKPTDIGQVLMMAWNFANNVSHKATAIACSYDGPVPATQLIEIWYEYFRGLTSNWASEYKNAQSKIGGPSRIVQIYESVIGRGNYDHRGCMLPGCWVLALVDDTDDMRLEICPGNERYQGSLEQLIWKHVALGSEIRTDDWPAYKRLDTMGYTHKIVRRRQILRRRRIEVGEDGEQESVETDDASQRLIESLWRKHCTRTGTDPFAALVRLIKIE